MIHNFVAWCRSLFSLSWSPNYEFFSQFETKFDTKRVAPQDPSFFNLQNIAEGTKHTFIQAHLAR